MRKNIHVTCHKGRIHLRGIHVTIYMCIFDKFMNPFANFATCWTKVMQAYKLLYGGCILLKKNVFHCAMAGLSSLHKFGNPKITHAHFSTYVKFNHK